MIRWVQRVLIAALLVAATLATGCGEAQGKAHDSITKSEAVAFARAVNLRLDDLRESRSPGAWRKLGAAPEPESASDLSDARFARCAGLRRARYVAQLESPQFDKGTIGARAELVSSKVLVSPTTELASRPISALGTSRGRTCFRRLAQPTSEGGTVRLSIDRVSFSPLGQVPPGSGVNVRLAGAVIGLSRAKRSVRLYFDILVFSIGPAEVVLFAQGWGHPPAPNTEHQLLGKLYRRAKHTAPVFAGRQVIVIR